LALYCKTGANLLGTETGGLKKTQVLDVRGQENAAAVTGLFAAI